MADAHKLVPALKGPFDFVFCDADKDWYLNYFMDLEPKMAPHGCYAAHNVLRDGGSGVKGFMEYARRDPEFRTSIEKGSGEGISISCKGER